MKQKYEIRSIGDYSYQDQPLDHSRISALPMTRKSSMRNTLDPVDEGPHFHRFLPMREWWYFNVVFDKPDSQLQNWSAMISFNYMSKSFQEPDILFITLYDEKNRTFGGKIDRERGTLQAKGPGVNVRFEDSWVKGEYPTWVLHGEDGESDPIHEISFDMQFHARCVPYWVFFNSGCGSPSSPIGYYSINHCEVTGCVTVDGTRYEVHGTGYHDHTWALYMIGKASYFWDWFSIHFDNGMHAFIWKVHPIHGEQYGSISPGICWITEGGNFTDIRVFHMTMVDFENTSIPGFKRPKVFQLLSDQVNIQADLYIETGNLHEYLWGELPVVSIGLWEGPCRVWGVITINGVDIHLNGLGIAEILRII
jgi:predicted secreted hydrolase